MQSGNVEGVISHEGERGTLRRIQRSGTQYMWDWDSSDLARRTSTMSTNKEGICYEKI